MTRFNNIIAGTVPTFLVVLLVVLAAGACGRSGPEDLAVKLSAEEQFFVEQYMRLVEARKYAVARDSLAAGRFAFLAQELPEDSLRTIARNISEQDPERWTQIFEEIVRRKKILEAESR